jgi:hypothetical protein
MTTANRKFPYPHPFIIKRRNLSPEQRQYGRALNGIRICEQQIGYYAERMAEYTAEGPHPNKGFFEKERQGDLRLCRDNIAIHQRALVEHQKVLASLPTME